MGEAALPEFDFDSAPRGDRCERCGAGRDADLCYVILRGRTRYKGRTLCSICTEEVFEVLVSDDTDGGVQA